MSRLILLGSPGTKRTSYLKKGGSKAQVDIELLDWNDFPEGFRRKVGTNEKIFLKIDPPRWDSCILEDLDRLVLDYGKNLEQISELCSKENVSFLNAPEDIKALLDKKGCKSRLMKAGIPVTEEIERDKKYSSAEELLHAMERQGIFQVFIKPNWGSGAAGVMALRYDPRRGQTALYTCGAEEPGTGRLVNTKRLRRFTDREKVLSLVGKLLAMDCIVERWHAKAEHGRYSYDLRAVVQDGEIDFMLARLSSGPITNLQLNNHPLSPGELGLPQKVWEQAAELCRRAAGCYPGLRSVGIDILVERGSLRPRVIEMNGQGDLIYQDIYHENRIYCRQAHMMRKWMEAWEGFGNGASA